MNNRAKTAKAASEANADKTKAGCSTVTSLGTHSSLAQLDDRSTN